VTDGVTIWLAIMATALVVMAAVQVVLVVVALRVGREVGTAANDLRRELRPLVEKINRVVDEASRATSLAAVQVERVDKLLATSCARLDEAASILLRAFGGPLQQAGAVAMAFRAAFSAIRGWQKRKRPARDEEDALFVG
jgi:hypothetical protein